MRPRIVWGVVAVIYALFTSWYTSCGGPLTDEEIERYVAILTERAAERADVDAPFEIAEFRRFLEEDTGDDFVMVNLIEMAPSPVSGDGIPPGTTAEEAIGVYMEHMWPALLSRACHPVLMGVSAAPALDLWGIEGAERWSQAGLMRYRSRRDMLEIATNPAFQGPHEYKIASMLKTIAFPVDPWMQLGDPRLVLGLVLAVVGLAFGRPARPPTSG